MLGEYFLRGVYLAAALSVGATVPILAMLRVLIGRRLDESRLALILVEHLLSLKALIAVLAIVRYSSALHGDAGDLGSVALGLTYALLGLHGLVTIYRVGKWWLGMRRTRP